MPKQLITHFPILSLFVYIFRHVRLIIEVQMNDISYSLKYLAHHLLNEIFNYSCMFVFNI